MGLVEKQVGQPSDATQVGNNHQSYCHLHQHSDAQVVRKNYVTLFKKCASRFLFRFRKLETGNSINLVFSSLNFKFSKQDKRSKKSPDQFQDVDYFTWTDRILLGCPGRVEIVICHIKINMQDRILFQPRLSNQWILLI